MPCYDERDSPSYIYTNEVRPLQERVGKLEAVLCGILTNDKRRDNRVLDQLNYKEMGVTRQWIERWWANHQEEDRQRRIKEQTDAEGKRVRLKSKLLSAEETVARLRKELGQ